MATSTKRCFLNSHKNSVFLHSLSGQFQLRTPFSSSEGVRLLEIPLYCVSCILYLGRRGGAVWCEHSPLTLTRFKSRPVDAICRLSCRLLVLSLVSRVFFFGYCTVLYCTVMQSGIVDEESFCGCAASKLFIY